MTPAETLTLSAYFFVLIILAVYGWHRYYLVYLYMRNRGREPKAGPQLNPLPVVTIQLPLYNEMYVADRLIDAVCRIEYPRELLEIQVLDDSVDETCSIAELAVRRSAMQGVDIKYYHRPDRKGFKAGALEAGLKLARGEFIAIFDADFMPTPDFLTRLMPHFSDPGIGMVHEIGPAGFSISTAPPACGAAKRSAMPAGGSTTRSPRTSISAIARSFADGVSCSCPISSSRLKCRWR